MTSLTEWEHNNFLHAPSSPDITAIFPSREIYISPALMTMLHLNSSAIPRTLDQWYELCHPEDHAQTALLERALDSSETAITLARRLYCGDGVYRFFRLEAIIIRDSRNRPVKLLGHETPSLTAWLETAADGDRIECASTCGSVRVLEAVNIDGVRVLQDISGIEDVYRENQALRMELQHRIFGMTDQLSIAEYSESDIYLRDALEETLRLSLNVLTGNPHLKAIRRSLNDASLLAGVCGLSGSGKTSLVNALLGEELLPSQNPSGIPVICREGEHRATKILYQDGRTENVMSASPSLLREILARKGVSRVRITVPGALIPSGISIMDTAGYDLAASTSKSSLRNILPELDVILYAVPVRSSLKGSDYAFLRDIIAVNSRVIILLTYTDSESEDTEAGRTIRTASAKIARNIDMLNREMKPLTSYEVPVIPVSSRFGADNFYSRKTQEWQASNLEGLMQSLTHQDATPLTRALVLKSERTLRIIDSALENKRLTGSSRWRLQDYTAGLRNAFTDYEHLAGFTRPTVLHEISHSPQEKGRNLLASLVTSLREHDFRKRFYSHKAFRDERNALLLSADKSQSLKLYSRLAHNLLSEDLPDGGASSGEWLCSGNYSALECVGLPVLSPGENILIAPSDYALDGSIDWQALFRDFTPVVSADLLRFSSGMSDLLQAPYFANLAVSEWVMAFGNAGLMSRNAITTISERVKDFTESCGLRMPELFIYENYRIF